MSPARMRLSGSGVVAAALAGMAVAAVIGLTGMASPHTFSVTPGSIRLPDADDDTQDQLNQMEEQLAQQTAQENEDIAQQEQQLVDQQNAFDESMTAGNN
jgi:hypothetical protein